MRKLSLLVLCLACAAARVSVQGEPKPPMTAEQVLERFIEATGGRAAYDKVKSSVQRGTMELTAQGMKFEFETYIKPPNKILVVQRMPAIGEIMKGYDGKIGWSKDPINGLRELKGAELALLKREAAQNAVQRWREFYKKVELVGTKKVGTGTAYVVRLVPTEGKPITHYYDTKTGLLVRLDVVVESPQGSFATESYPSDYRVVDGIKAPFTIKVKSPVGDMVAHVSEVKNNVEIDDSKFAKPSEEKPAEKSVEPPEKPGDSQKPPGS